MDDFLAQLYNPASPGYRQFLTPEQFAAKFGPSEADYRKVIQFAQANGLRVTKTYGNRLLVDVSGPVGNIQRAFQITLRTYRHPTENRNFFAPDTEPVVAADLPVADIQGLSDYSKPHSWLKTMKSAMATAKSGSAPNGSGEYFGDDFRNAYAPGTTLTGAGQVVGLFQADGFYSNDIAAYASSAGGGRTNIPIQTVLLDGFSGTPTTGSSSGNPEVSLDIEMTMSMAPGLAKIVVFEGNPNTFIPNDILNAMAANSTIKNLSSSWGWSGGPSTTTDNIFKSMAAQGQSYFNASGDSDAFPAGSVDNAGNTTAPSSSSYVTQVGGTTLTTSGTAYSSETVWNWGLVNGSYVGSSGGISTYYSIPSWQQGVNSFLINGGSATARNIPDVALTADNVYVQYGNGTVGDFGGTSCAAPLWAGFMALVNQQLVAVSGVAANSIGFINPAIYELANESIYSSVFHDVATGNNMSSSSPNAFYAVPGYDLCTGLGTPGGTNLINALINPDPLAVISNSGFNAIGTAVKTFNVTSETFYLTNAGASPLTWSLLNTSAWLNVSGSAGTLDPGASNAVVVSLNNVASNLNAGVYSTTLWFSNDSSGIAHSRFFTLTTADPLMVLPTNSFGFFGASDGSFIPAAQSLKLTNAGTGGLDWGINNTSAWFNVTPLTGSLTGGGQAAVAINLTATASNLPNGSYTATLQLTNLTGHSVQIITGSVTIGQSLVVNGGFETGDFTGWTLSGSGAPYNLVDNGKYIAPHSGSYAAALGQTSLLAHLSQTVATVAGQQYLVSLWLENPQAASGSSREQFTVSWNGNTLYSQKNPPVSGWNNLQFVVTATGSSSVLNLGSRNDPYYFGLDDVSVAPGFAPAISSQPTNTVVAAGGTASFAVVTGGSPPFAYQWRLNGANLANGANISGANSNVLTLTAVTTNLSGGNYSVVVTNLFGSTTSGGAVLTVVSPPVLTSPLTNQTVECGSNNVTFAANVSGAAPLNFQWSLDGAPVSGATNASFSLANVHLPSHLVSVTVTNVYGSLTTNAILTVQDTLGPVIALNGSNPIYVELGGTFSDPGATAADLCAGAVPVTTNGSVNTDVTGTNIIVYTANDGDGNIAAAARSVIVQDTTPPVVEWSFTNLVLAANSNCVAMMPDVTGSNYIVATDLSGSITVSQIPTNETVMQIGTNTVVITVEDPSGNAAYSTNTIVVADQTPPVILVQPQSQTNGPGATASFMIGATACTPLVYQWYSNDVALTAETNSTLTLSNLSFGSAGDYYATATAEGGSSTSTVATLTMRLNPVLTVASSENPSGFNDGLNFAADVTPTNATGNVQFFTNGVAFDSEPLTNGKAVSLFTTGLPRGKNIVTAVYSGDTNYLSVSNSLAQVVTNHPPAVVAFSTNRYTGLALDIPVASLASGWSDVDGDALTLDTVSVSTNGVSLVDKAGLLIYANSNNVADQFVCTVTDGWGGTNYQTVNISVLPLPNNALPSISSLTQNGGVVSLNLVGAPSFTYILQSTGDLLSSNGWQPIATNTLDTNGLWQFVDTLATNRPQQFYRLQLVQ